MAEIDVKVQPRSSQNKIEVDGDAIKVWVTAAPTDGQANTAVCELVAKAMGVAKTKVSVVRGETSRVKRLDIAEYDLDTIRQKLSQLPQ